MTKNSTSIKIGDNVRTIVRELKLGSCVIDQIELDYLYNLFSAYKSVAGMHGVK